MSVLTARVFAKRVGGPNHATLIGFAIIIGSLILALGDARVSITQVFVLCLGMCVIHTLVAPVANHNVRSLGVVVNGLMCPVTTQMLPCVLA